MESNLASLCRSALGVDGVVALEALTGGISGSGVFLVQYVSAPEGAVRLGVLKVTAKQADFDREVQGHARAARSWLAPVVPETPAAACVGGRFVMLGPLALGAGADFRNRSLHDALATGDPAALRAADHLATFYGSEVRSALRAPSTWRSARAWDLVRELLAPWAAAVGGDSWRRAGLPAVEQPALVDHDAVVVNPGWAAVSEGAWRDTVIAMPFAFQHGDLNLRNVMIAKGAGDAASGLRLIDWEKTRDAPVYLDLLWASLWSLIASAGARVEPADPDWQRVPEAFVDCVVGDGARGAAGAFGGALSFVERLFGRLREVCALTSDEARLMRQQVLLSLGAVALAKAAYEARDFDRFRARGEGRRQVERLAWATCFYRIAAIAWRRSGVCVSLADRESSLRRTDPSALGSSNDIAAIVRAIDGKASAVDLETVDRLRRSKHALADVAVEAVRRDARHHAERLPEIVTRIEQLSESDPMLNASAEWLLTCVDPLANPAVDALPPSSRAVLYICALHQANHRGACPGDHDLIERLEELRKPSYDLPLDLRVRADLHAAVAYANAMRFEHARALLEDRWSSSPCLDVIGARRRGQVYSSLGQYAAFTGAHAAADGWFDRALVCFDGLADAADRARQSMQTRTYKAINLSDWRPAEAAPWIDALARDALGESVSDVAAALATSSDGALAYVHHAWLRHAYMTGGGDGYIAARGEWRVGARHPWELIDLYRGLLCRGIDEDLASQCFTRAVHTAWSLGPTAVAIGLVVTAIGRCAGLIDDDPLVERAIGACVLGARRGRMVFDFDAVRAVLESPRADAIDGLLRLLPFNYR